MITVLGATAGGKTSLAVGLALKLGGEIISADSRQVYRGMDIGTGKDLEEYTVNDIQIPHHLIDIIDAGQKYNIYEYQADFLKAYENIKSRNIMPVLCGGSGMYIDAVLKGYKLINVPKNEALISELEQKSDEELIEILKSNKELHNRSDISNRERLIRAVEIALYYNGNPDFDYSFPKINSLILQVKFDRDSRRKRISQRLKERLDDELVEEVEGLLDSGIPEETLMYYGLEYKFLTQHIKGYLSYSEMFSGLETAIHQFSKRQETWFRKMENDGFTIHQINGYLSLEEKIERAMELFGK